MSNGQQAGPWFPLGGPATAAWREDLLTRVKELEGLTAWIATDCGADQGDGTASLVERIKEHLEGARAAAEGDHPERRDGDAQAIRWSRWKRLRSFSSGSPFERALGNVDAAEAHILRLAPPEYLCGLIPSLRAHVNRYLQKGDPRRERFDYLAGKAEKRALHEDELTAVVAAYHAANSQRRRDLLRLRSFRNVLLVAAGVMLIVAIGLGILGSLQPQKIPLCFYPDQEKVVCPTGETMGGPFPDADQVINDTVSGWDIWLVELVGLVAAALASAFALRRIRGTSMPYSLPVALAVLKLPTGAITAFLGILLMRGGFVPGLTALDTPAQILSWAIIFGYAQQLFTRLVDQQGHAVLENVRGRGSSGDREMEQRPAV
jgi:hypothetical protein